MQRKLPSQKQAVGIIILPKRNNIIFIQLFWVNPMGNITPKDISGHKNSADVKNNSFDLEIEVKLTGQCRSSVSNP